MVDHVREVLLRSLETNLDRQERLLFGIRNYEEERNEAQREITSREEALAKLIAETEAIRAEIGERDKLSEPEAVTNG